MPAPVIPEVAVQAPVLTPSITTMGEYPEHVRQEPSEPIVEHEGEVQQPLLEDVSEVEAHNEPRSEALRRYTRPQKSAISTNYKVITQK